MLRAAVLGWLDREHRDVIAFLREENRTLKSQLHTRSGSFGRSPGAAMRGSERERRASEPRVRCFNRHTVDGLSSWHEIGPGDAILQALFRMHDSPHGTYHEDRRSAHADDEGHFSCIADTQENRIEGEQN